MTVSSCKVAGLLGSRSRNRQAIGLFPDNTRWQHSRWCLCKWLPRRSGGLKGSRRGSSVKQLEEVENAAQDCRWYWTASAGVNTCYSWLLTILTTLSTLWEFSLLSLAFPKWKPENSIFQEFLEIRLHVYGLGSANQASPREVWTQCWATCYGLNCVHPKFVGWTPNP